jgi:hypothetical protein
MGHPAADGIGHRPAVSRITTGGDGRTHQFRLDDVLAHQTRENTAHRDQP